MHTAAPVVVTVSTPAAGMGAIGINFVGSSTTAMGPAETAGVVSKSHWNNAAGAARSTPLALLDETGAATGGTITWGANGTWTTPITDQAGNARMMKGYLDTSDTSTTKLTISGLAARTYDVYVYADGDNRAYTRSAAYTISGTGITTTSTTLTDGANTNFWSSFTRASNSTGNYVKFTINAGGFTLTATPTAPASGARRAPVNGIQIIPVTPPARAVGVNFVGSSATAMGGTESAGVVAKAHWNNAGGSTRSTPLALVDETGAASGATVTWAANGTWGTPITDKAGNVRMMKGYLDTTSTSTTTVTVGGLALHSYDVYVYADGDNRGYARSAAYTISGPGIPTATTNLTDAANANFTTTFTRASNSNGNYVKFTINASGFTVTARPTAGDNATLRAPINGIQIVPGGTSP